MNLQQKSIISFVLFFVIVSFAGLTFSSYAASDEIIIQLDAESFTEWMKRNWAVIALIISESAAMLPGKPKGILQSLLVLLNNIVSKSSYERKNYLK